MSKSRDYLTSIRGHRLGDKIDSLDPYARDDTEQTDGVSIGPVDRQITDLVAATVKRATKLILFRTGIPDRIESVAVVPYRGIPSVDVVPEDVVGSKIRVDCL
ncbi:hypothetical protein C499_05880 [Halogeometricum borinquense DSM 11551]|uniref:Uncharacterized protein n=1 Tax=Halogeometricum borinquense (strain ATCC 700274 / DSM 11551 / JCM 10706 / KCTC 4070 / PR3) TaxID=469382 RepID=L9UWQ7_HALBP|nr:hypothetical protein C499_05880 [Halogeometricum borinquense DSM 11551]